jgi:hypothetical protein
MQYDSGLLRSRVLKSTRTSATWLSNVSGRKSVSHKLWHALNESAYEQPQTGNGDDCEEARRTLQPKRKPKFVEY